jgi:predicted transcriptional regulator
MENITIAESQEKDLKQIRDIYEDEHWTKKYSVTAEELKETSNLLEISAKIIQASVKNKTFSF